MQKVLWRSLKKNIDRGMKRTAKITLIALVSLVVFACWAGAEIERRPFFSEATASVIANGCTLIFYGALVVAISICIRALFQAPLEQKHVPGQERE